MGHPSVAAYCGYLKGQHEVLQKVAAIQLNQTRVVVRLRYKAHDQIRRFEDEKRLSAHLEGVSGAPRTVTIRPQSLAELVGRQLSDRERDPVFRESMAVAQVFAQSVLG